MSPGIEGEHGSDQTFKVAAVLVIDFDLSDTEAWPILEEWNQRCQPPWSENDLRRKLSEARKRGTGIRGRLAARYAAERAAKGKAPLPKANADNSNDPEDGDATAADLIRLDATVRWAWKGWLPISVLAVLASEPGGGKTRLCCDLARRIHLGLPWPDGSPPTFEPGSRTLWVPADNQHPELGLVPQRVWHST